MSARTIREIAVSPNGQLAAAVGLGPEVFVWDLAARRETASFMTIFEFGGKRLAISDGGLVVAAAHRALGVACYDSNTGKLVWDRKDLKQVQRVSMSASSQFVYVSFDERPCKVLWTTSRFTAFNLRGVREVFESAYEPMALLDKKIPQVASPPSGKRSFTIERSTFGILDAAFSPTTLAISESAGPVRGFELSSGREIWRYEQPRCHIRSIGYSGRQKAFFGVECSYERNGDHTLIRLEAESGEPTALTNLGPGLAAEFCLGGDALVKSTVGVIDAELIDVASGGSLGSIPLPSPETIRES